MEEVRLDRSAGGHQATSFLYW